jgi:O-acetyl-ADP-ribose deacetylase
MDAPLDFSFELYNATLRVLYTDITALEVDAIVSSDNLGLSMSGGVSAAIRRAAGAGPFEDLQKYTRPVPPGSVLVTTAGKLHAKYIFHAALRANDPSLKNEQMLPQVISRIFEIARVLNITRLALPALSVTGGSVPSKQLLDLLLRSLAFHISSQDTPLQSITVAVRASASASDISPLQKKLVEELQPIGEQVAAWSTSVQQYHALITHIQGVRKGITGDADLDRKLVTYLQSTQQAIRDLFQFPVTSNTNML